MGDIFLSSWAAHTQFLNPISKFYWSICSFEVAMTVWVISSYFSCNDLKLPNGLVTSTLVFIFALLSNFCKNYMTKPLAKIRWLIVFYIFCNYLTGQTTLKMIIKWSQSTTFAQSTRQNQPNNQLCISRLRLYMGCLVLQTHKEVPAFR